jgi:ElaB/YqjD/DUF883 family membrane-anchored ribosome-binding protein
MTPSSSSALSSTRVADQAAQGADDTIRATQRVANDTLDRLSEKVHETHDHVARLAERAEDLMHRSSAALRESGERVRETALRASDRTVGYIRDEPVKAVLIAAAAGAAMLALANLISRSRH